MGNMLDFDRFLAEKREEYVTVTVYGRRFRVKKAVPALLPLTLARAGENGREALGKALLQAGDALFGREAMDGFCRAGMAADSLTALVEQTLALILGGEEETDGDLLTDEGVTEKSRADAAKK